MAFCLRPAWNASSKSSGQFMNMGGKKAAVIMAYGSPESTLDIDEYLQDIFGKNPVPPEARADNIKKYTLFGGRSPSNKILDSLQKKLHSRLQETGIDVFLAFKHWHPKLEEIADQIVNKGYDDIVEIPLFPFPSDGVFMSYDMPFKEELRKKGYSSRTESINGMYQYDGFLDLWVSRIRAILEKGEYDRLLLTAHSLPTGRSNEPVYKEAFESFSKRIADRFPSIRTLHGFQSRSKYGNSWLEPAIQKVILEDDGMRSVLVASLGFCYEHLEVLYDLDVDFSSFLNGRGIGYQRVKLMNDSDDFVSFLARIIEKRLS